MISNCFVDYLVWAVQKLLTLFQSTASSLSKLLKTRALLKRRLYDCSELPSSTNHDSVWTLHVDMVAIAICWVYTALLEKWAWMCRNYTVIRYDDGLSNSGSGHNCLILNYV